MYSIYIYHPIYSLGHQHTNDTVKLYRANRFPQPAACTVRKIFAKIEKFNEYLFIGWRESHTPLTCLHPINKYSLNFQFWPISFRQCSAPVTGYACRNA